MLKRLIVGLVIGIVIGFAAAALLVKGLGLTVFPNALVAYLAAVVTGVVSGLVAGKPIWSQGGRIEAGLKALFGAALAAFGMFALRTWTHVNVDLASLGAGTGSIAELPATSLPILAAVLSGFFELDNTPEAVDGDAKKDSGARSDGRSGDRASLSKKRVAADELDDELDEPVSAKKQKR